MPRPPTHTVPLLTPGDRITFLKGKGRLVAKRQLTTGVLHFRGYIDDDQLIFRHWVSQGRRIGAGGGYWQYVVHGPVWWRAHHYELEITNVHQRKTTGYLLVKWLYVMLDYITYGEKAVIRKGSPMRWWVATNDAMTKTELIEIRDVASDVVSRATEELTKVDRS